MENGRIRESVGVLQRLVYTCRAPTGKEAQWENLIADTFMKMESERTGKGPSALSKEQEGRLKQKS